MNTERKEWIISSGGILRYKVNRQIYSPSIQDLISDNWNCEDNLFYLSENQLIDGYKKSGCKEEYQEILINYFKELSKENKKYF